ncbi:MAG: PQQ-binding-like beta-propeller repeat protein [Acidobacteria bacterium]|nr:PQQ-binding-like beta-propeller repeat protein [Acidobacteriota bacterium]
MRLKFMIATWRLTLAIICFGCVSSQADDWSRFRGPNGSGVAEADSLPVEFGPKQNVVWKAVVASGNSSPVLAGDRIFLTAYADQQLLVLCLDRKTGKTLWQKSIGKQRSERRTVRNDPASPTPVTDGKNIYAFFSDFGLISYDFQGQERWRIPLGPFKVPHGMATSPILADARIILVADQTEGSYIAAFDKDSGRLAWKTLRLDIAGGHSTPIVYKPNHSPTQVVVSGPLELTSYAVETGKKLWAVCGMGINPISVPVFSKDIFYINTEAAPTFEMLIKDMKADKDQDGKISISEFPTPAYRGTVRAVDQEYGNQDGVVDAKEWNEAFGLTESASNSFLAVSAGKLSAHAKPLRTGKIKWRVAKSLIDVPSVLLYREVIYLIKSGGIVTTVNAETGEIFKQARLQGAIDSYFASPVAADGKIFFVSENGKVVSVKAGGKDWEILAVNDLDEQCYATPAIADGRIYIRTKTSLYAFGKPDKVEVPPTVDSKD